MKKFEKIVENWEIFVEHFKRIFWDILMNFERIQLNLNQLFTLN